MEYIFIPGLEQNGLSEDAIEYVVCTDGHVENIGNLNLFPKATFIVGFSVAKDSCQIMHDFINVSTYTFPIFIGLM